MRVLHLVPLSGLLKRIARGRQVRLLEDVSDLLLAVGGLAEAALLGEEGDGEGERVDGVGDGRQGRRLLVPARRGDLGVSLLQGRRVRRGTDDLEAFQKAWMASSFSFALSRASASLKRRADKGKMVSLCT